MTQKTTGEQCDFNPAENRASYVGDDAGACGQTATLSVGKGWHLCERCAALPRFARMGKKPMRAATKARLPTISGAAADLEEWLRSGEPCADEPCRVRDALSCGCAEAADTVATLRRFVQFVADHSNDPIVVKEAKLHGAE